MKHYNIFSWYERRPLTLLYYISCSQFQVSNSRDLKSVEYPFIIITPKSTATHSGGTSKDIILIRLDPMEKKSLETIAQMIVK